MAQNKNNAQTKASELTHLLCVTVADGKYTVILDEYSGLRALRYGEEWRDCCGDGLIYTLAAEIEELREKLSNT